MKKFFLFVVGLLVSASLMGCGTNGDANGDLTGKKPPNVNIKIDGKKYETKQGSYCWTDKCVDKVRPTEILKKEKPIQVKTSENIDFVMKFTPKPNEVHLSQVNNGKETDVEIKDNQFTAPNEKGIYLYDYDAKWVDKKDKSLSHGSASYVFALEVK